MEANERKIKCATARRGSVLVMVVVLTVLLALLASVFLLTSRLDEMSTVSIQAGRELDAGVDVIVEKIETVLVEDLFGTDTNVFRFDGTKGNEPWDYPGDDDIWLANLEPELVDVQNNTGTDIDQMGFRHITDLYGQIQDMFLAGSLDEGDGAVKDYVDVWNLRAKILDTDASIEVGDKADADGDGVSDSRWVKIPDMSSSKGEAIYAAVRIIDNGGMLNINTAYRDPSFLAMPGDWDGTQLSHVNLEGIISQTDSGNGLDATDIQIARYGTVVSTGGASDYDDYRNDIEYEENVARRVFDPNVFSTGEYYLPFDISDELELRNRFFLSTSYNSNGTVIRSALAWPTTFNPQGDPGKGQPYNSSESIENWYAKVGPEGLGSSNRRHYCTAYNNERVERVYDISKDADGEFQPGDIEKVYLPLLHWESATEVNDLDVEVYIRRVAMGIKRALPDETILAERFGERDPNLPINPLYTPEGLSWQMAVNMVDYQDDRLDVAEDVTQISFENAGVETTTYFGVEDLAAINSDTLCISKIAYRDHVDADSDYTGRYYAIEVFNPDDNAAKNFTTDNYDVTVTSASGWEIISVPLTANSLNPCLDNSGGNTGYFVVTAAPNATDVPTIRGILGSNVAPLFVVPPAGPIVFRAGDKIIVTKSDAGLPVDCVTVPYDAIKGSDLVADNALHVKYRRTVLPGTNLLLPSPSYITPGDDDVWETAMSGDADVQLGEPYDPIADATAGLSDLIDPNDSWLPELMGLDKVQLDASNRQLRNIGEIENVFAVGPSSFEQISGNRKFICRTLVGGIVESLVAIRQLDDTPDDLADTDEGIDMGSFGRIRLDDPDYWGLLDSFTHFDLKFENIDDEDWLAVDQDDLTTGDLYSLTDGMFLPVTTFWNDSRTVNWTDPTAEIDIDLNGAKYIYGVIVQADGNDEYTLDFYDDSNNWVSSWTVENYGIGNMQVRPDKRDNGRWHFFDEPFNAAWVRVTAVDNGGNAYSVSEIQLAISDKKMSGRININTAPWYVINQLPWVVSTGDDPDNGNLAQGIVAFRDKAATPVPGVDYSIIGRRGEEGRDNATGLGDLVDEDRGFKNIGQLMQVINIEPAKEEFDIRKNIFDVANADIDYGDYSVDVVVDDIEERNLIFHRMSNLVTVRSDVFTAYILVRIGSDGPQRRMMAIFDRSGVSSGSDKPKLVALHPIADTRR